MIWILVGSVPLDYTTIGLQTHSHGGTGLYYHWTANSFAWWSSFETMHVERRDHDAVEHDGWRVEKLLLIGEEAGNGIGAGYTCTNT
jgi:hypothetical protein